MRNRIEHFLYPLFLICGALSFLQMFRRPIALNILMFSEWLLELQLPTWFYVASGIVMVAFLLVKYCPITAPKP